MVRRRCTAAVEKEHGCRCCAAAPPPPPLLAPPALWPLRATLVGPPACGAPVAPVVHQEQLQVLDVGHDELEEAVGQHVARLGVGAVANVGHRRRSLELAAHAVVNTCGDPARVQHRSACGHHAARLERWPDAQHQHGMNRCRLTCPALLPPPNTVPQACCWRAPFGLRHEGATAIFTSLWWRLKCARRFFTILSFLRGVTISLPQSLPASTRRRGLGGVLRAEHSPPRARSSAPLRLQRLQPETPCHPFAAARRLLGRSALPRRLHHPPARQARPRRLRGPKVLRGCFL